MPLSRRGLERVLTTREQLQGHVGSFIGPDAVKPAGLAREQVRPPQVELNKALAVLHLLHPLSSDTYSSRSCCLTGKCYYGAHRMPQPLTSPHTAISVSGGA